jgi:hypothetical protein
MIEEGTKVCPKCSAFMLKRCTGNVLLSYPPKYPRQRRCGCGHREPADCYVPLSEEQQFMDDWKKINE